MRRRTLLVNLTAAFLTSCRAVLTTDSAVPPLHSPDPEVVQECSPQSLAILLSEYPELTSVGGSVHISFADQFVHLLVVCIATDHWIAVWNICSHGDCDVEWDETLSVVRCPCHNSLFDIDGSVLEGPADRALKEYVVCRQDNTLYVSAV